VEKLKAKEKKLLYHLFLAHKQIMARDAEIVKLTKEVLELKGRLGERREEGQVAHGLVSLKDPNSNLSPTSSQNSSQPSGCFFFSFPLSFL